MFGRAFRSTFSSAAGARGSLEAYALPVKIMHWGVGGGVLGCVGFVTAAQQCAKGNPRKGELMFLHKSCGLLVAVLMPARIAVRLATTAPPLPAGTALEHIAAHASHAALYAGMIAMPISGVAMGYFGGKGLPFFGTTFLEGPKRDGKKAGQSYWLHKQIGWYWKFLIPVHVGAVGVHAARGQNILPRIL